LSFTSCANRRLGSVADLHKPRWRAEYWDGHAEPLIEAARAAIEATHFDPLVLVVSAAWDERAADWSTLDQAEKRLRHDEPPETMSIALTEGLIPAQTIAVATTHIFASDGHLTVSGSGTDWAKVERGFQAAKKVLLPIYGSTTPAEVALTRGGDAAPAMIGSKPAPRGSAERGVALRGRMIPWEAIAIAVSVLLALVGWLFFT
jgi:hypothetical protein